MGFQFNPNPNFKKDAVKALDEKLRHILSMRCAEHNRAPEPRTEDGKLRLHTCCDNFEAEVTRAMQRHGGEKSEG
jgi:hypothetical protein